MGPPAVRVAAMNCMFFPVPRGGVYIHGGVREMRHDKCYMAGHACMRALYICTYRVEARALLGVAVALALRDRVAHVVGGCRRCCCGWSGAL
jgi:hypothetical protein